MLEIKNGHFAYHKGKEILTDVNFKLKKQSIVSILGPNGVGKTTMLKCMIGLLKWTKGSSYLDGKNLNDMSEKEIWSKISYIPQIHSFSFSYTGLEMVLLGLNINIGYFSNPSKRDIKKARNLMAEIGISHLEEKDCNEMSGGELQMVLIARALISEPEIVILDEPETGLDFHNQLLVLNLIKELVDKNAISAIMNTHYPTNALMISDHALIMDKNGSSIYGETEDIINAENIEKTFNVEVIMNIAEHNGKSFKTIIPVDLA